MIMVIIIIVVVIIIIIIALIPSSSPLAVAVLARLVVAGLFMGLRMRRSSSPVYTDQSIEIVEPTLDFLTILMHFL